MSDHEEAANYFARLESQNQALQERMEELKTLLHEERLTRYKAEHSLAELVRRYELRIEQAVALQERAEKAEAAMEPAKRLVAVWTDASDLRRPDTLEDAWSQRLMELLDALTDALSPTQETDPE